jgi:uncharacterized membrane protein YfcA
LIVGIAAGTLTGAMGAGSSIILLPVLVYHRRALFLKSCRFISVVMLTSRREIQA